MPSKSGRCFCYNFGFLCVLTSLLFQVVPGVPKHQEVQRKTVLNHRNTTVKEEHKSKSRHVAHHMQADMCITFQQMRKGDDSKLTTLLSLWNIYIYMYEIYVYICVYIYIDIQNVSQRAHQTNTKKQCRFSCLQVFTWTSKWTPKRRVRI